MFAAKYQIGGTDTETINVGYHAVKRYNAASNLIRTEAYNMHDIGIELERMLNSLKYFDRQRLFLENDEMVKAAELGIIAFGISSRHPLTKSYQIDMRYEAEESYVLTDIVGSRHRTMRFYPETILDSVLVSAEKIQAHVSSNELLLLGMFKSGVFLSAISKFFELGVDMYDPVNLFIVESFAAALTDIVHQMTGAYADLYGMRQFNRREVKDTIRNGDVEDIAILWGLKSELERDDVDSDIDNDYLVASNLIFGYLYFMMEYDRSNNTERLFDTALEMINSKLSAEDFISRYNMLGEEYDMYYAISIRK
ncbi:hypothetical protein M1367_04115 [Candidatus Marsarchaeota archaeon]|nr:hypothetical protein [Candidatus Marsarchaeota archaeon]